MSADTLPIDPAAFAIALESLPPETLHHKAAEIRNSIGHLKSSNEQMLPFADEGDVDCREAMFENLVVIGRMNERVRMIREEVERRGLRWSEAEVEDAQQQSGKGSGTMNGHAEMMNGRAEATDGRTETTNGRTETMNGHAETINGHADESEQNGVTGDGIDGRSGRLSDDELRRRLEQQMTEDDEAGVHL